MTVQRLVTNSSVVAFVIFLAWAVYAVVNGLWVLLAAATTLWVIAFVRSTVAVGAVGLIGASYTGEVLLFASYLLLLLTGIAPLVLPVWATRKRTDPALLTAAVNACDPQVAQVLAATAGDGPISTVTIGQAAAAQLSGPWQGHLDPLATADWDGGLVRDASGRTWTSMAAEAQTLADRIAPEAGEAPHLQVLAAAALLVPDTALEEVLTTRKNASEIASRISGLSSSHLDDITRKFVTSPAGADATRRAELRLTLDSTRELSRRLLFSTPDGHLWRMHLTKVMIRPIVVMMLIKAALLVPWRGLHRLRRRMRDGPAATRGSQRHMPSSSSPSRPAPSTTRQAAAPPRPQTRRLPGRVARYLAWLRMAASLTSWPATLELRVVRPLCTVAAAILALVGVEQWWARILVALSLLALRPLRRWWLDFLLMAAAAFGGLLPVSAVLLLRAVVTGVVVGKWGVERSVTKPRQELVPFFTGRQQDRIEPPEGAWTRYVQSLRETDEFGDGGFDYVSSVWTRGDGPAFILAMIRAFRVELLGWFPVAPGKPVLLRGLVRFLAIEYLVKQGSRLVPAAGGAATAIWTVPYAHVGISQFQLPIPWLCAALAVVIALQMTDHRLRYRAAIAIAAVQIAWLGSAVLPTLASVLGGVLAARAARGAFTRRLINVPPRLSWVGWWVTGWRDHGRYYAASLLAAEGRRGIAVELLSTMAEDCQDRRPSGAAVAMAQCALIELDRGNLQCAVEHADEAGRHAAASRSRTAAAAASYAYGIVQFSVGAYAEAVAALYRAEPVLGRRPEGGTCMSLLAQAHAALVQPEQAMAAAMRVSRRLTTPGQLHALIESQMAAGWALLRDGQTPAAKEFVEDVVGFLDAPLDTDDFEADEHTRELRWRLLGEACLLLGRAHLALNEVKAAQDRLEQSMQHLRRTNARDLLGMAQVYKGHCHRLQGQWDSAVTSVTIGAKLLEKRRGQLRTGANRASAVVSGSDQYSTALDVLVGAQRRGDSEAGSVAASLVESLRRNALATMLRDERSAFAERLSPQARQILDEIARLELAVDSSGLPRIETDEQGDLEQRRRDLATQVSAGFARIYLPEEVDYRRLSAAARRAHILQYEIFETSPDRWRGFRIWVPPGGAPQVDEIMIDEPPCLAVLTAVRNGHRTRALMAPFETVLDVWAALAIALLPSGLIQDLRGRSSEDAIRLLIVPGEHLAYLPWAPLLLDEDNENSVLLQNAVIQVVPSLALLRPSVATLAKGSVLVYLDEKADNQLKEGGISEPLLRLTTTLPTVRADSRGEFVKHLAGSELDCIYVIAHGRGAGFGQGIVFSVGGTLSASAALEYRWPRSMVFGSCFVATVEQRTGQEPFGLVIACMLGGCRSVIGGLVEVERWATTEITTDASISLASGIHPAVALRDAQRAFLAKDDGGASVAQWGGLICISTEWSDQSSTADSRYKCGKF